MKLNINIKYTISLKNVREYRSSLTSTFNPFVHSHNKCTYEARHKTRECSRDELYVE